MFMKGLKSQMVVCIVIGHNTSLPVFTPVSAEMLDIFRARGVSTVGVVLPSSGRVTGLTMPKYFCDYCDTYLTHDSPSVRKTHCSGRKHKENVKIYYQKWMEEQAQSLIDATTAAFKAGKIANNPFAAGKGATGRDGAAIPPPANMGGPTGPRPNLGPTAPAMGPRGPLMGPYMGPPMMGPGMQMGGPNMMGGPGMRPPMGPMGGPMMMVGGSRPPMMMGGPNMHG